ncbi:MAG: phosphoribosyltransferase family protein [Acidimicrobiia bacterium]
MALFRDRTDAGQRLAARLGYLRDEHPIVVGLPRGGVPVAFEVARALEAPLDVIVVRKLGVPFQPELGMGAIGEDGVRVLNDDVVRLARVSPEDIAAVEARERSELERRANLYRGGRPMIPLAGRTVIVVDDGIATGGTARAALEVSRAHGASRVVLAVPVAPSDSVRELSGVADEVVAVETPSPFFAVGQWYAQFMPTQDGEVVRLLEMAAALAASREVDPPADLEGRDEEIEIAVRGVRVAGHLTQPVDAVGIVVFAHGSGSSRHSPRNQFVARHLNRAGLATLLFDLLTPDEALDRAKVFDIELLADRLQAVARWLRGQPETVGLGVGYFGASTGAAAALWAAAGDVTLRAVVSRGGRPDLAMARLADVHAPTLLIVGGDDTAVLELNRLAADRMSCEHRVDVVPGATHLFEEPGALETVAHLARDWFLSYLSPAHHAPDDR